MNRIEEFLSYTGQTNQTPYLIDVERAEGIYIIDKNGKKYMDMISGVSVNNIGHSHPHVIQAIKNQVENYMHVMVYGEYIQDAHLNFCKKLCSFFPEQLNCVYTVNSGTEANEAALKLAKRVTNRTELVSFRGSYHGSTHGSMSVSGNETKKEPFRPLLPDVRFLQHNNIAMLEQITTKTAGVIIETIQGDAGVRVPSKEFLQALRKKCTEVGALLIFDEIQCGMGRTGKLFAFEKFDVKPDILLLAKAFGGGLPLGAFISSSEIMKCLGYDPPLGHITTFGGHPLSCSAALANLEIIEREKLYNHAEQKADQIIKALSDLPEIKEIRYCGLLMALQFESAELNQSIINRCFDNGLITDWFLYKPDAMRIAPPMTITTEEINEAITIIREAIKTAD